MALKAAMPVSQREASVPPARITSASPRCRMRVASPIECVEAAQAVTTVELGPRSPKLMATWAAAMLGMIIGA